RLKQGITRELGHEVAGEPTDCAEGRGARPSGAGPALVIVAVADDTDPTAFGECIVEQPLERAPGRMHFHGTFKLPVMGERDIRIASTNMGDDHSISVFERTEQRIRGEHRFAGSLAVDQNVRGPADRTTFAAEEDIAVTAHAGVA